MEIHNEDSRPRAQRQKVELTKKVTHETPSAQRSIKSNAASAADKTISGVGNVIVTSADRSATGGAAIAHSVKAAQAAASAAAVSGRVVKTAIKTSVKTSKIVAKVPHAVKNAHFVRKFAQKKGAKRTLLLIKRNFKPQNIATGAGKAVGSVGGIAHTGASITGKASSALQNTLNFGDGTGAAAAGLALQGGRILTTGIRASGKAVKTGTKVTIRTVKAARKIATKVERKITTGTAKRTVKTSAKAAKQSAEAAKKAAESSAKGSVKIAKALVTAVSKAASLIASTAPLSLIFIGAIALILCGGFLLSGGAGVASAGSKKQGFDVIANSSYSDDYVENYLTDDQVESIVNAKTDDYFVDVNAQVEEKIIAPLEKKVDDFLLGGDSSNESSNADNSYPNSNVSDSIENISTNEKNLKIVEISIGGSHTVFYPAEEKIDEISRKISDMFFDSSDFLAVLFTLTTEQNAAYIDEDFDGAIFNFNFTSSEIEELLGEIDSNSCKYGATYLYKKIEELSECSCPDQNCDAKDGLPFCPGEHTKLTIELCPVAMHEYKPISMIYNFSDDDIELYNTAKVLLGGD